MAEGGGDKNPYPWNRSDSEEPDNTDSGRNSIANQSRILMNEYINRQLQQHGIDQVRTEELFVPETPTDPRTVGLPSDHSDISAAIIQIGDQLDGDPRIQSLLSDIPDEAPHETFLQVARNIFSDNEVNWGRVVILFYFAAKMAVRALAKNITAKMPIVRTVIEWVVKFIKDYVASWIISRGGWKYIFEYFGSSTAQVTGVFLLGVLSAFLTYHKYK